MLHKLCLHQLGREHAPGDLKFKDLNGDGIIDNKDRTFLGSFIPKFTYSFNLGANYKNFGLSVFFQGVQGNKIYNATTNNYRRHGSFL